MIWALRNWRIIAAVGFMAGLFYAGWHVRGNVERADDLRASNASLRAELAEAQQTAAVMQSHYARQARQIETLDAQAREFSQMEGRDAPLSNHMLGVAGKLWPEG